jgi:hypothetical protein
MTGDVILNTRVSRTRDPGVIAAVEVLQGADVTHAHLEIPLHDFDASDIVGSAEGALSWMRAPTYVADELRWLGVDLVSTASNHSLDYSYGGLRSTLDALRAAGLPHAGTGADLAGAAAPAFADTASGRIALVSATSSFPTFARAGATRSDALGRPGVNPLRALHVIDADTAATIVDLAAALGLWAVRTDEGLVVHPPGLHNSVSRFRITDTAGRPSTCCDPDDLTGYLQAVRQARATADFVIAHLHVQAWDAKAGTMSASPAFVREFAHAAIAAGAGVVLAQGSHAPMRGVEIHEGVPVLHDPGPLFRLGRREVQPHDFYLRWGNPSAVRSFDANLLDAFRARDSATGPESRVHSPRVGNAHEPGFVVPLCAVDSAVHRIRGIELVPMSWSTASRATAGFPVRATGSLARRIVDHIAALSAAYDVTITFENGSGWVHL